MCGIFGIFQPGRLVERNLVQAATESLEHRGPDNTGVFVEKHVGLGHTRLSIVDLSEQGNQPQFTPDGRYAMVFNGEVYNYRELRRELEDSGVPFRSQSDTEVLLQAFASWGTACFERLNGIFAVGYWDDHEKRLTLARDRLGVKPLYLHQNSAGLSFASEVKAILSAIPDLPRRIDPVALHEFLYFGVALGGRSIWKGIEQLRPGCFASYSLADPKLEITRYWEPHAAKQVFANRADYVEATRNAVEQAVKTQLTGDVPIGVFLSGGLDSSSITAFAAKHYPKQLETYSVDFEYSSSSELELARLVAQKFDTNHHEIRIQAPQLEETIQALVRCHDAPFGDAANIPLYLLCREVKGRIKVVLQGDGGDEIFGGYRRYNTLNREGLYRLAAGISGSLGVRRMLPRRIARYLECYAPQKRSERFARLLTTESSFTDAESLLDSETRQLLAPNDAFARYAEIESRHKSLDSVEAMMLTDLEIILPDIFLEKVDRSTMAHGVEVRVPMLENELVDFAISVPSSIKVRKGEQKSLLREALVGVLPDELIHAKKKGFGVPFTNWLKEPLYEWAREVVLDRAASEILCRPTVEKRFDQLKAGQDVLGFQLWKMLQLALWMDEYKVSM